MPLLSKKKTFPWYDLSIGPHFYIVLNKMCTISSEAVAKIIGEKRVS
jgi:hypothetical protein